MKMITCASTLLLLVGTLIAENAPYSSESNRLANRVNQDTSDLTINVANDPKLGKFLTDDEGMTLYMFTSDKNKNESTCYDQCAAAWPPLLISSGKPTLAPGIAGTLDATKRSDDSLQVTYNGMPLYYYVKDKKPGDVYGQNVDNKWFVVQPK